MDYLREGIHLRSMAQRDPVAEYQRGGLRHVHRDARGHKEEALGFPYNVQVQTFGRSSPRRLLIACAGAEVVGGGLPVPTPIRSPRAISPGGVAGEWRRPEHVGPGVIYTGPAETAASRPSPTSRKRAICPGGAPAGTAEYAKRANLKNRTKPPKSKKQRN